MKKTFRQICEEMVGLYEKKNADYAQGGDQHGNFKRVAKFFEQYPNLSLSDPYVIAVAYMMKQLDALLWSRSEGYGLSVESADDKSKDVTVYSIIMRMIMEELSDTSDTTTFVLDKNGNVTTVNWDAINQAIADDMEIYD